MAVFTFHPIMDVTHVFLEPQFTPCGTLKTFILQKRLSQMLIMTMDRIDVSFSCFSPLLQLFALTYVLMCWLEGSCCIRSLLDAKKKTKFQIVNLIKTC